MSLLNAFGSLVAPESVSLFRSIELTRLAIKLDLSPSDWRRSSGRASTRSIPARPAVGEGRVRASMWESSIRDCFSRLASSDASFLKGEFIGCRVNTLDQDHEGHAKRSK
jgi:hypothetical protein